MGELLAWPRSLGALRLTPTLTQSDHPWPHRSQYPRSLFQARVMLARDLGGGPKMGWEQRDLKDLGPGKCLGLQGRGTWGRGPAGNGGSPRGMLGPHPSDSGLPGELVFKETGSRGVCGKDSV